jgi:hypothetical protein
MPDWKIQKLQIHSAESADPVRRNNRQRGTEKKAWEQGEGFSFCDFQKTVIRLEQKHSVKRRETRQIRRSSQLRPARKSKVKQYSFFENQQSFEVSFQIF